MALDPSIALSGRPAPIMSPGEQISLQQMSQQMQREQAAVERQKALQGAMKQPGMFNPETGAPTAKAVQTAYEYGDTQTAHHLLTASMTALRDVGMTNRANTLHATQMETARIKQKAALDKRIAAMTPEQYQTYTKTQTVGAEIDTEALAAVDAAKAAGNGDVGEVFQKARLEAFHKREASGALKAAGWSDEMILQAEQHITSETDPEVARERLKTRQQERDPARDPGDGWQADPKNVGSFIQTGSIADAPAGTANPSAAVELNPKLIPKGWTENPWLPGRIMPMPEGPYDPSARGGKGSKTQLGKIHDDFRDGKINAEEASALANGVLSKLGKGGQATPAGGVALNAVGLAVATEMTRKGLKLPGGYSSKGQGRGNAILNELGKDPRGPEAVVADMIKGTTQTSTAKAFATGKQGQNATAINTAIGHLGTVDELAAALGNKDVRVLNAVINRIATETGNPNVNNYEVAVDAVGHELMRVFRQVGASEGETKAWEEKFKSSNSPAQMRGAIKTAAELLQSRIDALNDEYDRAMGTHGGFPNMLSPKSAKVIKRLGGHVSSGADSGLKGKPPPPSSSAPGAAAAGPATPAGPVRETPNSKVPKVLKWDELK